MAWKGLVAAPQTRACICGRLGRHFAPPLVSLLCGRQGAEQKQFWKLPCVLSYWEIIVQSIRVWTAAASYSTTDSKERCKRRQTENTQFFHNRKEDIYIVLASNSIGIVQMQLKEKGSTAEMHDYCFLLPTLNETLFWASHMNSLFFVTLTCNFTFRIEYEQSFNLPNQIPSWNN